MNKIVATILLSFLLVPLYAQPPLEGFFCRSDGGVWFETDCIYFHKNGSFEYIISHCTGESKGNGKYTLKSNQLILNFETPKKTNFPSFYIEKEVSHLELPNTKISLETFFLSDSTEMAFVSISLLDSNHSQNIESFQCDEYGKGQFEMVNANQMILKSIGQQIEVPLQANFINDVRVWFPPIDLTYYISEGKNMSFKIKGITKTNFLLKRYEDMRYLNYELKK